MAKFKEINTARNLLNLDEEATLDDIKKAYNKMSKRYHPDKRSSRQKDNSEEMMKKINWAYKVLMEYIKGYRYSFKENDVRRNDPDYVMEKFRHDWMWGPGE